MADPDDLLAVLEHGELEVLGRLLDASNATLYCVATLDGVAVQCVHKPVMGERPLWDFPDGTLAAREVAAYRVAHAAGWAMVPPTVLRDGPFGPGMAQQWIEVDEEVDPVELVRSDTAELRRIAVLDAVINNADRKGGHLLPGLDGTLYAIDHGVCFSVDDKLRTVLWAWRGRDLPEESVAALQRLLADFDTLATSLADLLAADEVAMTRLRIEQLLQTGLHPQPSPDWPAVPWPPF
jgi:uncharacterized repeat protein (TIGR03843 family)